MYVTNSYRSPRTCAQHLKREVAGAMTVAPAHLRVRVPFATRCIEARGMLRPMSREFAIEFTCDGGAAESFRISSLGDPVIRGVTVAGRERRTEVWPLLADGRYHLIVRGAHSLLREFRGVVPSGPGALYEAQLALDDVTNSAPGLRLANFGENEGVVVIMDLRSGEQASATVSPDEVFEWHPRAQSSHYDYCMTSIEQPWLRWRFAGGGRGYPA